jgi:O-methyltransferase
MNGLYRRVAGGLAPGDLPFMNYGYAEPDEHDYDWIRPEDRAHKYHFSLVRRALGGLDLRGKALLEVGSGRGGNCAYLARYSEAASIRGVDPCWENIDASSRAVPAVKFVCGDAAGLPFQNASFDIVLNVESSHCYPDFAAFLAEVRRVLRPGGFLAYTDIWFLDILPYDWQGRLHALESCGLSIEQDEDISEPVFRALKKEDGFSSTLTSLECDANRELFQQLVRGNEAIRLHLATAYCRYRRWLLRRPEGDS